MGLHSVRSSINNLPSNMRSACFLEKMKSSRNSDTPKDIVGNKGPVSDLPVLVEERFCLVPI